MATFRYFCPIEETTRRISNVLSASGHSPQTSGSEIHVAMPNNEVAFKLCPSDFYGAPTTDVTFTFTRIAKRQLVYWGAIIVASKATWSAIDTLCTKEDPAVRWDTFTTNFDLAIISLLIAIYLVLTDETSRLRLFRTITKKLARHGRLDLIEPVQESLLPIITFLCVPIATCRFIYQFGGVWFLWTPLPAIACFIWNILSNAILGRHWKARLLGICNNWMYASGLVGIWLTLLFFQAMGAYFYHNGLMNAEFGRELDGRYFRAQSLEILESYESPPFESTTSSTSTKESPLPLTGLNIPLIVTHLLFTACLLFTIVAHPLSAQFWKFQYVSGSCGYLVPPGSMQKSPPNWLTSAVVGVGGVLFGLLYWQSVLLTVELASFLTRGKVFFILPMEFGLGKLDDSVHTLSQFFPWLPPAAVWVLPFMLPGLYLVLTALPRLTISVVSPVGVRNASADRIRHSAAQVLQPICNQKQWSMPRIVVIKQRGAIVRTRPGLFGLGRCIELSRELGEFPDIELQALLCHELYHVRFDAPRLEIYRLLSIIFLHPIDFFSLAHDFPRSKLAADRFAAGYCGPETMLSALIRIDVHGRGKPSFLRRVWKIIVGVVYPVEFANVGNSYPFIQERREALLGLSSEAD